MTSVEYDDYGMPTNLPILDKNGKALRVGHIAKQDKFDICQIKTIQGSYRILVKDLIGGIDYWTSAQRLEMIPEDEAIILMLKQNYER